MRIRSTKPEFWRSKDVTSIKWEVVYDGPMPTRLNSIAPMRSDCEYVYLLFNEADELLYVGRSFRPADRFTKHRRKAWWPMATGAVIIRVEEVPPFHRKPWDFSGPNTARLEALAIRELHPSANVAAPARRAMG
ncbi:GIY-YIG nuclease family protein [Plantibacter sp. YIM 135249]|uniref:GIY-YIG nuclease family protein n=1 Tax=Plantibacter sp. YIM 135249 TaxID=3423918 RepID=UPI003D33DCA2